MSFLHEHLAESGAALAGADLRHCHRLSSKRQWHKTLSRHVSAVAPLSLWGAEPRGQSLSETRWPRGKVTRAGEGAGPATAPAELCLAPADVAAVPATWAKAGHPARQRVHGTGHMCLLAGGDLQVIRPLGRAGNRWEHGREETGVCV